MYNQLVNLHKIIMIFLVSNDGIQLTLDFGPDSVTISIIDLEQKITIPSCLAIAVVSKTRLLEQSSSASSNYPQPARNIWNERRSTLQCGAQDLGTSSYQLSDLEDIEFNWENSQLYMDAVFRPSIDTTFSPTTFADLLMGDGSVENPIVLDEEKDKENAPPPTTPEFVRPNEPPRLQRSRAFGARLENVPEYVFRNLFQ